MIVNNNIELTYINLSGTNTFIYDGTPCISPVTIINTSLQPIIVTLIFYDNINNILDYLIVGSNSIVFDGRNSPINVDVENYGGLIQGNSGIYRNITIENIQIKPINSGSISNGSGWIVSGFTCVLPTNPICTAYNCFSTGDIPAGSGGIFGSGCINCEAYNCYSNGNIMDGSGGIFGSRTGSCMAYSCYSTGNIIDGSGGIFGKETNYNMDAIIGISHVNTISEAKNCFSTGIITNINGNGSGGIFGYNSNLSATNSYCNITNCYSTGNIGGPDSYGNGGIYGSDSNTNGISNCVCHIHNASSYGNIYGDISGSNGGIFGGNANSRCSANNCFSIGNIGIGSGGIYLSGTGTLYATRCYSIGNIEENAGGIYGNVINGAASYCYSNGNIGNNAGGIFGKDTQTSTADNCYSLGYLGENAGGIFGNSCVSSIINNCYVLGSNLIGSNDSLTDITNSSIEDGIWNDNNANMTINIDNNNMWFSYSSNTPFLLFNYTDSGYMSFNSCPRGYKYTYVLPNTSIITDQNMSFKLLVGYYTEQQEDTITISPNIYGYIFNNGNNINITVSNRIPEYINYLFDGIKKPILEDG